LAAEDLPEEGEHADREHGVQGQQPSKLSAVCDRDVHGVLAAEVER
jgi:hypothetical protein